jgi:hypothetical protein
VGGVYRDRGVKTVRKWLIQVIQPHVEAAYQDVRNDFLMSPESEPESVPRSRAPTAPYPPPPSFASSEGAEPALSSRPAWVSGDPHRSPPPPVNVQQQGSGRVGGDVENHHKDLSRGIRRRRRSSQGDSSNGDSGKQGLVSPKRHY